MFNLNDVVTSYRPLYNISIHEYCGQKVVYNGRNIIITLVKKGMEGEPCLVINNGFTVNDPFFSTIKADYDNCWIYAYYFKLSNPEISSPKRKRTKRLLHTKKELFGCEGLNAAGKELYHVLSNLVVPIILVGHSKSATMICKSAEFAHQKELFSLIAVSPIFRGTYSTMMPLLKHYLGLLIYPFEWIYTGHIVDDDIAVGSSYMQEIIHSHYHPSSEMDLQLIVSTLDKRIPHSRTDLQKPSNLFRFISPLMDTIIQKEGMYGNYKSDCLLPFATQCPPPFYLSEDRINIIYSSLAGSFSHSTTRNIIQAKINEKNTVFKN